MCTLAFRTPQTQPLFATFRRKCCAPTMQATQRESPVRVPQWAAPQHPRCMEHSWLDGCTEHRLLFFHGMGICDGAPAPHGPAWRSPLASLAGGWSCARQRTGPSPPSKPSTAATMLRSPAQPHPPLLPTCAPQSLVQEDAHLTPDITAKAWRTMAAASTMQQPNVLWCCKDTCGSSWELSA